MGLLFFSLKIRIHLHGTASYFEKCLSAQDLDEMNIEIIRNTLYKAYLEDFYAYCLTLGGPTAEVMGEILKVNKVLILYIPLTFLKLFTV